MSTDVEFSQLLEKYSQYLTKPTNTEQLLELGQKLFGPQSEESITRPSFALLKSKETELNVKQEKEETKVKNLGNKPAHARSELQQLSTADQISEEILIVQDRNALLLSRRKKLEDQRNEMLTNYGELMEQSVQRKVQLKLEMQKLKAELNEALSRSRPGYNKAMPTVKKPQTDVMEELTELNQQVLMRIRSFKMATSTNTVQAERAVLDRYKPHMEKILGQIYAYSEYLPVSEVIDKFNSASEEIEHQTRDIETQLKSEHERNFQLQKEATQLGDEVKEQEVEATRLKQQNTQLSREIDLLKEIAEAEIAAMQTNFKRLLDAEDDTGATPSSARATVVSSDRKPRKLKRTPSRKRLPERESAALQVPPIEHYIESVKATLLNKINHAQIQ